MVRNSTFVKKCAFYNSFFWVLFWHGADFTIDLRVSLTFYWWLRYLVRGIFDATLGSNFTQILDSIMDLRVWVWNHRCVISRFSTGLGTGKKWRKYNISFNDKTTTNLRSTYQLFEPTTLGLKSQPTLNKTNSSWHFFKSLLIKIFFESHQAKILTMFVRKVELKEFWLKLKFGYSEKATKFEKIFRLKGVFSKSSGKMIVAPIFCFWS